jgi:hypothetical protein
MPKYPFTGCFLCLEEKVIVSIYCKNYKKEIICRKKEYKLKNILSNVFSKNTKFYLPPQIQDLIFKYIYKVYYDNHIFSDINSLSNDELEHITSCKSCAQEMLYYFKEYACCAEFDDELEFKDNKYSVVIKFLD